MTQVVALTDEELDTWVHGHPEPLVVEFYSRFCFLCHRLETEVGALAEQLADQATAIKVDVTDYPDLATRYELHTVPTVMLFCRGRCYRLAEGRFSKEAVRRKIAETLADST